MIISDDISLSLNYPLVMFEGGETMLKNLPSFVTHILIFFAPNFSRLDSFRVNLELELLNLGQINGNFYAWFKI